MTVSGDDVSSLIFGKGRKTGLTIRTFLPHVLQGEPSV